MAAIDIKGYGATYPEHLDPTFGPETEDEDTAKVLQPSNAIPIAGGDAAIRQAGVVSPITPVENGQPGPSSFGEITGYTN